MPFGGIHYTRDTLPCFAKMLSGEHAKKSHNGIVGYGDRDKKEYEELMYDLFPQFPPYFKESNTSKGSLGFVLVRRAAFYLPPTEIAPNGGNEQQRFLSPDFELAFRLVQKTLERQKPITNDDIGETREQSLLMKYGNWSGVYINSDLNRPELIYIGNAKKITDRIKGHLNSPLYLSNVLGTATEEGRKLLEGLLQVEIVKRGAIPHRDGTRGLYKFSSGVNAMNEFEKTLQDPSISYVMRNLTREESSKP